METKSPSCRPSAAAEVLILEEPLALAEAVERVSGPGYGAVATFSGTIRDVEEDRPIGAIRYEAYRELALRELGRIIAVANERWGVKAVIRHRIGRISVGEAAVVLAVAAPHRQEAFDACAAIMDRLKEKVPIWKTSFEEKK